MLIFRGVACFDKIPVEERGSVEFVDWKFPIICTPYWYPISFPVYIDGWECCFPAILHLA